MDNHCQSTSTLSLRFLNSSPLQDKSLVERFQQYIETSKLHAMRDTRFVITPSMSIDILIDTRGSRNPMDLASVLNPLPPMQLAQEPRQLVNLRRHPRPSSHKAEGPVSGKKKKRKPTGRLSNKPYTQEQLHWLQYHLADRGFNYAVTYNEWDIQFPGDSREPKQGFSSRLYRENIYPMLDDDGGLARDRDGKPIVAIIGVRQRRDPEFRDFPFKLWEKNPEWALYWDWVLPEHKAMAQKILEGRDLDESQLRKERTRQAIRIYEAEVPAKKGWFATPALHAAAVQTSPSPERAML